MTRLFGRGNGTAPPAFPGERLCAVLPPVSPRILGNLVLPLLLMVKRAALPCGCNGWGAEGAVGVSRNRLLRHSMQRVRRLEHGAQIYVCPHGRTTGGRSVQSSASKHIVQWKEKGAFGAIVLLCGELQSFYWFYFGIGFYEQNLDGHCALSSVPMSWASICFSSFAGFSAII